MGIVSEFRAFALRGNVIDLAVGVIIGGAFGKIVTSMVGDIIMPLGGMAGKADFNNMYCFLKAATNREELPTKYNTAGGGVVPLAEARALNPVFAYGNFITEVLNFVILAACIFLMVKLFNTARKRFEAEQKPAPAAPPGPTKEEQLLTEIRDILAKK